MTADHGYAASYLTKQLAELQFQFVTIQPFKFAVTLEVTHGEHTCLSGRPEVGQPRVQSHSTLEVKIGVLLEEKTKTAYMSGQRTRRKVAKIIIE